MICLWANFIEVSSTETDGREHDHGRSGVAVWASCQRRRG